MKPLHILMGRVNHGPWVDCISECTDLESNCRVCFRRSHCSCIYPLFLLADLGHYMPRTLEPLMPIEEGNY